MGSNPTGPVLSNSLICWPGGIREKDTSDPARGCVFRIVNLRERSEPQIEKQSGEKRAHSHPVITKNWRPVKTGHYYWLARFPGHLLGSTLELSRRAMLLEALPAIYRPALGGLERYLAVFPAVRALRVVHLSGATKAPASASLSVSVSHVLTLYFLTSPSRIMFAYCAPLRERHYSNHLPRWFVWRYINVLVSKGDPHILVGLAPCSPGPWVRLWL